MKMIIFHLIRFLNELFSRSIGKSFIFYFFFLGNGESSFNFKEQMKSFDDATLHIKIIFNI